MRARHVVSDRDLSASDVEEVLALAAQMKARPRDFGQTMTGKTLILLFMRPSTRTRVSFEAGMTQLGGHAIYMQPDTTQMSRGESLEDTARILSVYGDLIVARVGDHAEIVTLADHATVPVINGLSEMFHPVQILADIFTIRELFPGREHLKLAYVGDGNNICHSLMIASARAGFHMVAICPAQYAPNDDILQMAQDDAEQTGAEITVTHDLGAVDRADVVYTDTWVSMGQAHREQRLINLQPYKVNAELMARADPSAVFMHCLPAHRGEEVSTDVIDGSQSIVFAQAANRLHVQKALTTLLLQARGIPLFG
jgi:ornithine carbamoyltransferase